MLAWTCSNDDEEIIFDGSWEVFWSVPENLFGLASDTLDYTMDGRMHFIDSTSLEIWTYGHAKCVMGKDTVRNVLKWRFEADTLWVGNQSDSQLGYALQRIQGDTLYMQMFNEVFMRLVRIKN